MALPTRFRTIWRNRPGSPRTRPGRSGAKRHASSRPFLWACRASDLTLSPTQSCRSKGMDFDAVDEIDIERKFGADIGPVIDRVVQAVPVHQHQQTRIVIS